MTTSSTLLARTSDRTFYLWNAVLSAGALAFIGYLLLVRRGGSGGVDLRFLPAVNAGLNALSATFLTVGWLSIRRKAVRAHKFCMTSAFATSSVFLVGYLVYHYVHGDTKYAGQGPIRAVYFLILITHILLSAGVVPMALAAFYYALKRRFDSHKKVTRWALPIWLYVSVTGVVIFFMLRGSAPAAP